jgi:transaldolase
MAKAGIKDYEAFAREILKDVKDLPISFEVFCDEFDEMERQAHKIASWAPNVNVKIPITNTKGQSSLPLVQKLLAANIKLNVTAIFTMQQLANLREIVKENDSVIVSVFAGRIADTGISPVTTMKAAVEMFAPFEKCEVLWASPREVYNIYEAEACGCDIITATSDLISKLKFHNKDLEQFSLETVEMFYRDAMSVGYQL